jgi:muconolactone delta-isomerase
MKLSTPLRSRLRKEMTTELANFKSRATEKSRDLQHRGIIRKAIRTYDEAVVRGKRQFTDWQAVLAFP